MASSALVSQVAVEVLEDGVPAARASQIAVEVALVATPPSRAVISQLAVEVVVQTIPISDPVVVTFPTYETHYELRLVNRTQYECTIDDYLSFDYTLVVNDIGILNLELPGTFPKWRLKKNWRIEVWRGVGFGPLRLEGDTQFIIQSVVTNVDEGGNKTYRVTAYSLNHILKRRLVAYPSNNIGYGYQIDRTDNVMKALVRQNYGTLAIASRNISTFLSIDADTSQGPAIEMDVGWKVVLDALKDIANSSLQQDVPLFFEIIASDPPGGLVFRVFVNARGLDRRASGTSGRPLILSSANGSLGAYTITEDDNDEVNYVYAFGPGQDDLQMITEVTNAQETVASVFFARKEGILNNSQADTIDALEAEAYAMLASKRPKKVFQAQITNVPGALYGVHWLFGDWVTAETDDDSFDVFISAVHVTVSQSEETIEAVLRNDIE